MRTRNLSTGHHSFPARRSRWCALALVAAAGGSLGWSAAARAGDLPQAMKGTNGPDVTFNAQIVINTSLDLSGGRGWDGVDGFYYPQDNGNTLYSAQVGGDGGDAGDLTLNAGGAIILDGTESILLVGGDPGHGGTAAYGIPYIPIPPWIPVHPDVDMGDGYQGLGGSVYINAPTTMSLSGQARIYSMGSLSGNFNATGLTATLSGSSEIDGFLESRVSASSITLGDSSRFKLFGRTVLDGNELKATFDQGSLLRLTGGTYDGITTELTDSTVRVEGGVFRLANFTDVTATRSLFEVSGGEVKAAAVGLNDHSTMRVSGGVVGAQGTSLSATLNASTFEMTGGQWNALGTTATNASQINLLGGSIAMNPRGAVAYTVTDSTVRIGSGGVGPTISMDLAPSETAFQLTRSTMIIDSGSLDLRGAIVLSDASTLRVNSSRFNAGYVSGTLDWQSGTVAITDNHLELGASSPLGVMLGGATPLVDAGKSLIAEQGLGVGNVDLIIKDGGLLSAGTLTGLGTAPGASALGVGVTTGTGATVRMSADVVTGARTSSSPAPALVSGSFNLAGGQLTFLAQEAASTPRTTLQVTGSASNGTLNVAQGINSRSSVQFIVFSGNAALSVGGPSTQITARLADASFGGLQGTGGVFLEGGNRLATTGLRTFSGALSGPGSLELTGAGEQQFNAAGTRTGATFVRAGTTTLGAQGALGTGAITLDGGTLKAGVTQTLANALNLSPAGGTIHTGGVTFTSTGAINPTTGAGGPLTITGGGEWVRASAATYAGGTTITGGATARLGTGLAVGTGEVTLDNGTIKAGAVLVSGRNALKLGSAGGTIDTGGSANAVTWNFDVASANGSSDGGLNLKGGGQVYLSGAKTYRGGTTISGNTFAVVDTGAALGTGEITLNAGGLRATQFTVGRAGIRLGAGGGAFDTNGQTIFWGHSLSAAAGVTNDGGIQVFGSGVLELTGSNTYKGNTVINAGVLRLNNTVGSATGLGSVLVQGGTLSGTGHIGSSALVSLAMSSGAISPGNSAGTLSIGGLGVVGLHGGELIMELGSQSDLITFSSLSDHLRGLGTTLRIVPVAGFSPAERYRIFSNVQNAGSLFAFAAITGVDTSLQPSLVYDSTMNSYVVTFVPAPGTAALAALGGALAARRRRGR